MERFSFVKLAEIARAQIAYLSADVEWRRLVARLQVTDEIAQFIDRTALETAEREVERWHALLAEILRGRDEET